MRRVWVFALSFFIHSAFAEPSAAQAPAAEVGLPTPRELLSELAMALRELNYSGEFIYEHGSRLESFRVYHSVIDGEERELLLRQTGSEQGFVRNSLAACGTIGGYLMSGSRLSSSDGQYFGLDRYYDASLIGRDRIAGRLAWVIQLAPKDEHRFGINLSIDAASFLPLQYVIFDLRKNRVLERMQFVDLYVGEIAVPAKYASAPIEVDPQRCVGSTYSPQGQGPWRPTWLPPGFILTGYAYSEEDGHMETYTDGLSSFSIFVKELGKVSASHYRDYPRGVTSKGAVMALISTMSVDKQVLSVSVVGELPLPSAQKVSLSLQQVAR